MERSCIGTLRGSPAGRAGDCDVCVIDTPPALANRTFGALLAADAVLAPIGINDHSSQGVAELPRSPAPLFATEAFGNLRAAAGEGQGEALRILLADTTKAHGVVQPVVVRPTVGSR